MKLFQSIAFRVWIIFTLVGLCISIPMALYYNQMQFSLLQKHTKMEFAQNAKITSNAIKTALEQDDFILLQNLLTDLREIDNYAFVAIIETQQDGTKKVFACNPEKYSLNVLNKDTVQFYYSQLPFSSEILNGEVVIASSKANDLLLLKQLNRPLIYLTIAAVIASTILFGFSMVFLSRPIFKAVEIAKALGRKNYSVEVIPQSGKDEISVLNNALGQLKEDLIRLDNENKSLLYGLEERIAIKTEEIKNKSKFNKLLLDVSRFFMESNDLDKTEVILRTFQEIRVGLNIKFMGIFSVVDSKLMCQYNHDACPLFKTISQNSIEINVSSVANNTSLIHVERGNGNRDDLSNLIFNEIEEAESIYLEYFSNENNQDEIIILVSEERQKEKYFSELENMINVYFTLYTNFKKSKVFQTELLELNRTLEKKVLEKTQTNLEMSNTLIAQDKLATIGELSAGVAHDLNTPLAAVKAASQNLRSIIDELLTDFKNISTYDLDFVIRYSNDLSELPKEIGALDRLKKFDDVKKFLFSRNYTSDPDVLARKIIDSGYCIDNHELIENIILLNDPIRSLTLLNNLLSVGTCLNIIDSSVLRSSMVISNLSLFSREDLTQKREPVDLNKSIKVIEALFKFRLSGNIELISEVPPESIILGIEMKLFQVWTNLVKNAIDAMEDSHIEKKYIRIHSEATDDTITIHFENNGPRIKEENIQRIFKKFFTTKQKSNGTGLGLSIVSNIVSEHYGKISLTSDDEKTIFSVSFPKFKM